VPKNEGTFVHVYLSHIKRKYIARSFVVIILRIKKTGLLMIHLLSFPL
jgi:hypothetical protein